MHAATSQGLPATALTAPVPEVVIDPALSPVGGTARALTRTHHQAAKVLPSPVALTRSVLRPLATLADAEQSVAQSPERRRHGSTLTLATLSQMKAGDLTSALSPLSAESVVFSH